MDCRLYKESVGARSCRLFAIAFALACSSVAFAQTNKEWRDSLATLNHEIELNPKSIDLRLRKAAVNLQLQQWEYAAEEYGLVLRNDPQNISALYFRAYANNNLRRYDLAKNDYEDILKQSPRNLKARLGLAYTFIRLDKQRDALDEMNTLVEQHPDSAIAYAARANLERDMKQYEAAIYDWDVAIKLSNGNVDYIVSKVDILILLNRKEEAKTSLDEAVRNGTPSGALREWYQRCKQ